MLPLRRKSFATLMATAIFLSVAPVAAQVAKPTRSEEPAAKRTGAGMALLKGRWVRPDGGYVLSIDHIGTSGELDAMYFNPNPIPLAKMVASRAGKSWRIHAEIRAGGYGGSTYDLTYDPASDQLKGVYYQAVAKQQFEVVFNRE